MMENVMTERGFAKLAVHSKPYLLGKTVFCFLYM